MLSQLSETISFEQLASPIRALPEYNHTGVGRRLWLAVVMLKNLPLAK